MMKNKSGFTLVELLAVIFLLSIISILSVVSISRIKKSQDAQNEENAISAILSGAKRYVADNRHLLNGLSSSNDVRINLSDLEGKYVEFDSSANITATEVKVKMCGDKSPKLEYSITIGSTIYDDCGCDEQDSASDSKKICSKQIPE